MIVYKIHQSTYDREKKYWKTKKYGLEFIFMSLSMPPSKVTTVSNL